MLKLFFVLALFTPLCVTTCFAQDNEAAMQLYNKGVKLLDAGKGDAAREAFQAIIDKYPTSAYAKLAHEGLDKPLVASIEFVNLAPLSEKEVRKHFEEANARLMVGRPYQADYGDQAIQMLAGLIVKKKMKAKNIVVSTKELPERKVAVTITVVK
jgi:hypothetical protein